MDLKPSPKRRVVTRIFLSNPEALDADYAELLLTDAEYALIKIAAPKNGDPQTRPSPSSQKLDSSET